jgi:hypothetical protein
MTVPTRDEMIDAITIAARSAVSELFRNYPDHRFYYCSLITSGAGHAPALSAWSRESLVRRAYELALEPEELVSLKWSHADSPFVCYGDHHFEPVRRLFEMRPGLQADGPQDAWDAEVELRIEVMEAAMARLDAEGLFGTGTKRAEIVIIVEVMPPDYTNTQRAFRLNPRAALEEWLAEAAEPE